MVECVEPAYPVARHAAARVHAHMLAHLDLGGGLPLSAALIPPVETIEKLVNVAFWTSLRREESYTPRVSLAWVAPTQLSGKMSFELPVPFTAQALTRLAPAVERAGIHLCVAEEEGQLQVWAATRNLPPDCLVLEVVAPGLLVLKQSRGETPGKFVNLAVLQGDELKVIDGNAATASDCPELLTSLLGLGSGHLVPSVNVLIQLAVSMREHGRGGLLLVVPAQSNAWRDSLLQPMTYAISPPFSGLVELMQEEAAEQKRLRWRETLRRTVDHIAGLTAVDGATVLNTEHEVLAFGVKIIRRRGHAQVSRVYATEPIEGTEATLMEPAQLGGTRHLSAAQFTHDQRDSIALVASQDGRFTVFGWSPCEGMVHAHRLEALLL